ncbi:tyrosinase [Methylobacterium tarhaniae]|uniref:Tyrosinase n=1 Tax=Methylobacterium tarhaniae TaxID=1187852 RepID=A0A0J6SSV4_9HYPH|nr:tyrosinase family protein [Methylobacterium tarhaniae]KMO36632.1 tyrosinase [Methylobacterium tarhaniae]
MFVRKNVYELGSDWSDTVLWYARAVAVMQARPVDDPTSWRFYGAIHGFDEDRWRELGFLTDHDALPDDEVRETFWDQCQHQTWYFLPWHRGYLWAFERVVRDAVVSLGGPADWSLPYWNYFGPNQAALPPAFAARTMPDGTPNPLYVPQRYGPQDDGDVYIPLQYVNLKALDDAVFTGGATGGSPGFGGVDTGFSHDGIVNGGVEAQPHNVVHVLVGGESETTGGGLMSDPATAGLDPIFWLHHANIDRLWQVWRERSPGHVDPSDDRWVGGPATLGQRPFVMPLPGTPEGWTFTPGETESTVALGYAYDDVSGATAVAASLPPGARAAAAGAPRGGPAKGSSAMSGDETPELVGASHPAIPVVGAQAQASVALAPDARKRVSANLAASAASAQGAASQPERVLLNLENVRGLRDGVAFQVYVGPQGSDPSGKPECLAGGVGLFGVRQATVRGGAHGGSGLTFVLDITAIVAAMQASRDLDAGHLEVRIVPNKPVPAAAQISIGRVSVYRQGQ